MKFTNGFIQRQENRNEDRWASVQPRVKPRWTRHDHLSWLTYARVDQQVPARWSKHRDRISGEMHFVGEWARAHHVPLTCNEFGVYRNFSSPGDRARWIEDVRGALEANGIGWAMWDYRGGFGVVTKANGTTTPDERILHALGLK